MEMGVIRRIPESFVSLYPYFRGCSPRPKTLQGLKFLHSKIFRHWYVFPASDPFFSPPDLSPPRCGCVMRQDCAVETDRFDGFFREPALQQNRFQLMSV